MLPILRNHNHQQVIGRLECTNGQFFISFTEDSHITPDDFSVVLNGAIIVLETYTVGEAFYLKKVRLLSLSYT